MLGGDQVSLQRMFSLISRPLDDFDDLYYPSFAEWVACEVKLEESFRSLVVGFLSVSIPSV